jgi:hypothetical protein
MVLSTAVVMTTGAAAVRVPVLAAIFMTVCMPILTAVFAPVFLARRFVGFASQGRRGQQRAGHEQGTKQLRQSNHC